MNLHNLLTFDKTLLDGVIVPEGIDAEILKNEIVLQCGLLTPVYGEPEVFKTLTAQFFAARQWEFEHLLAIINAEYSPIENVYENRVEQRNIDRSLNRNVTGSDNENRNRNVDDTGEIINNSTSEKQTSAFNESAYQPDEKTITNATTEQDLNTSETETTNRSRTDTTAEGEKTGDTFTVFRHGNIGVTTNFQLINGELELLANFNLYKWIALQYRSYMFIEVF